MDEDFFAPKIWDFAYLTGQAPSSTTTNSLPARCFDAPVFVPSKETTIRPISRQESAYSSSSSSSTSSSSSSSSNSESSIATPPETSPSPFTPPRTHAQLYTNSMPTWARALPEECVGKNGLQGSLLFPTNSMPRSVSGGGANGGNGLVIGRSRKGIHRPGHPVLKLSIEERDRV